MILHVGLGSRDEECTGLMDHMESPEIDVVAIHDVNRPSFQNDQIQRKGITHFPAGNMDKTGNRPAQIKQRVHLGQPLWSSENPPTETVKDTNRLSYCRAHTRY